MHSCIYVFVNVYASKFARTCVDVDIDIVGIESMEIKNTEMDIDRRRCRCIMASSGFLCLMMIVCVGKSLNSVVWSEIDEEARCFGAVYVESYLYSCTAFQRVNQGAVRIGMTNKRANIHQLCACVCVIARVYSAIRIGK